MNTILKRVIVGLLLSSVTITMGSLAIKSCIINQKKKEFQKAKKEVNENFKKPYAESDSIISTTPKTDIGAAHSEVEQRRFSK